VGVVGMVVADWPIDVIIAVGSHVGLSLWDDVWEGLGAVHLQETFVLAVGDGRLVKLRFDICGDGEGPHDPVAAKHLSQVQKKRALSAVCPLVGLDQCGVGVDGLYLLTQKVESEEEKEDPFKRRKAAEGKGPLTGLREGHISTATATRADSSR